LGAIRCTSGEPETRKGGPSPSSPGGQWFHIRQNKHHRWALDERQIYQYHLGAALHPHIRWWEAIDVPRRSVQIVEVGEGITIVSLVCEDLAQNDDVAEVVRLIGPTIVSTALLDGPQLTSRWPGLMLCGVPVIDIDPGCQLADHCVLESSWFHVGAPRTRIQRTRGKADGPNLSHRARCIGYRDRAGQFWLRTGTM
jgi:hypothetical protein